VSLRESSRAPGLLLGDDVEIADGASIGGHVVIHDGVRVGAGCALGDHAVIGKRAVLGAFSTGSSEGPGETVLEEGAAVLAGAIVFAGALIGPEAVIGDQAHVRERSRIGSQTVIGRGSAIDNDVMVGDRVRVQSGCYLTGHTVVEDDVFIGPGVTTTNDDAMGRHGPGEEKDGPTLRRASRVGGGAVLCPGVEIGEEAFVAAGAVVAADVPARTLVMGVPARAVREVADAELLENWR
jgi:acetyltransferase-like isoleucine patch superfamily enzyme